MLLQERIPIKDIDIAEKRLTQFADNYQNLYKQYNVTINVHLMRHIGAAVRNLGPLWCQSAFGMEDNNGHLVKTTAKKNILQSTAWKYMARQSLRSMNLDNDRKITVGGPKKIKFNPEQLCAMQGYDFDAQKPTIYDFMTLNGK